MAYYNLGLDVIDYLKKVTNKEIRAYYIMKFIENFLVKVLEKVGGGKIGANSDLLDIINAHLLLINYEKNTLKDLKKILKKFKKQNNFDELDSIYFVIYYTYLIQSIRRIEYENATILFECSIKNIEYISSKAVDHSKILNYKKRIDYYMGMLMKN